MSLFEHALYHYEEAGLSVDQATEEAYWLELEYFDAADGLCRGCSEEERQQLDELRLQYDADEEDTDEPIYEQAA